MTDGRPRRLATKDEIRALFTYSDPVAHEEWASHRSELAYRTNAPYRSQRALEKARLGQIVCAGCHLWSSAAVNNGTGFCKQCIDKGRRAKFVNEYKEKNKLNPELTFRENDNLTWVIKRVLGDDTREFTFDNEGDAKELLVKMKELYSRIDPEISDDNERDKAYSTGYSDGLASNKHSLLWSSSEDYRAGWVDGEGDRLMDDGSRDAE